MSKRSFQASQNQSGRGRGRARSKRRLISSKAYVVLESEARGKISEEEIINFCKENLAYYKVPKIIEFRGELPKTDVGKVSRRELREESEER